MADLTSVIEVPTSAPFPKVVAVGNENENALSLGLEPDENAKVQLNVCSEFMQHTAPVSTFDGGQMLRLVADSQGQPMVFSLGADKRLYCLFYVDRACHGWQRADITPTPTAQVIAFDVFLNASEKSIHVAAAVQDEGSDQVIHHVSFIVPSITYDISLQTVVGFDPKAVATQWKAVPNNQGPKVISRLLCGPTALGTVTSAKFQIAVGTTENGTTTGSYFLVDPSEDASTPWKAGELPQDVHTVLGLDLAASPNENGIFILYEKAAGDGIGCIRKLNDRATGEWLGDFLIPLSGVGEAKEIFANTNPWRTTDLLVAGSNGVFWFNYTSLDNGTPEPLPVLQNVSFKQVICSEAVDLGNPKEQTKIVIFAISDHDELFYAEGIRPFHGHIPTFSSSGLPIRVGVDQISTQYNAKTDATELLYVTNGVNEIRHLSRDPATTCWNEHSISVPSLDRYVSYSAYVTSITVTNEHGDIAPQGYGIGLTAEPLLVTANDRTYTLDHRPTVVPTDANGRVTVIIPVEAEVLSSPALNLTLTTFLDTPVVVPTHPAQRVMRKLGAVKTSEDLKNTTSTTGNPIFANADQGNVDATAHVLSNFPGMLGSVDPNAASTVLPNNNPAASEFAVGYQKDTNGVVTVLQDLSFMDELEAGAVELVNFIGDLFEHLKHAAASALKVVLKAAVGVLNLVVEVAGKIIKVVVKAAGTLLRGLSTFLKDVLGTDLGLGKLMDWLGFVFDLPSIKKSQEVLKTLFQHSKDLSLSFLDVNKTTLHDGIRQIRDDMKPYIKDSRPPDPNIGGPDGALTKFMHNPVVQAIWKWNPIALLNRLAGDIMEMFEEAIEGLIELPDFSVLDSILDDTIVKTVIDELDIFVRFIQDVMNKVEGVVDDPKTAGSQASALLQDGLWTLFDSMTTIVEAGYDFLTKLLAAFFDILEGQWKLPVLSPLWDLVADQPLSILNVGTFFIAAILNLHVGKPAFDVLGDPSQDITGITSDMLDLHKILHVKKYPGTDAPTNGTSITTDSNVVPPAGADPSSDGGDDPSSGDGAQPAAPTDNPTSSSADDGGQQANQPNDGAQSDSPAAPSAEDGNQQANQPVDSQGTDQPADSQQADQPTQDTNDDGSPGDDLGANSRLEMEPQGSMSDTDWAAYQEAFDRYEKWTMWTSLGGGWCRFAACSLEIVSIVKDGSAKKEETGGKDEGLNRLDYIVDKPKIPTKSVSKSVKSTTEVNCKMNQKTGAYKTVHASDAPDKLTGPDPGSEATVSATGPAKGKVAAAIGITESAMALLQLIPRIMQTTICGISMNNETLKHHINSSMVGNSLALYANLAGFIMHIVNRKSGGSEQITCLGNLCLCIATVSEMICVNLIDGEGAGKEIAEGVGELVASGCGAATALLVASEEFKEFAILTSSADCTLTLGLTLAVIGLDIGEATKPPESTS